MSTAVAEPTCKFRIGDHVRLTAAGWKAGLAKRGDKPDQIFDVGRVVSLREDLGLIVVLSPGDETNMLCRPEFWEPLWKSTYPNPFQK